MKFLNRNHGVHNFITNKKGQVAIFVIVALVIVGGVVAYFFVRNQTAPSAPIPADFQKAFDYYSSCIEREARTAVQLAESQGGRIYQGVYIPGNDYAPSGNQLNFLGFPVTYWYYISANGLVKQNAPSKTDMSNDIARYIEENVNNNCDFGQLYSRGVYVDMGNPKASVKISDSSVDVSVDSGVTASNTEGTSKKNSFSVSISSKLGSLYNTAVQVYQKESRDAFLENYTLDTLRLYAPVDGVDLGCSGKVWKSREVVSNLLDGLEANVAAIKFKGSYYTLQNPDNKYFVVDSAVTNAVRTLYSKSWPTKVEIYGADGELMVAEPVGTQAGLGFMGFCYAPYHFVYDLQIPVLFQVSSGNEIFQFPVVVKIDKNAPREAYYSGVSYDESNFDLCAFQNKDIKISVYNVNLNPIDANLSFTCFSQKCTLGQTTNGVYSGKAPACANGNIVARADGYAEKSQTFSSNEQTETDVILDRQKDVQLELDVGGVKFNGNAIITFMGESYSSSAALPDSTSIKLSEGLYNVSVYVYDNASLTIPSSTKTVCNDVPKSGILGFFGGTTTQCTNIVIPATNLNSALVGGGTTAEVYVFDSDIDKKLIVDVDRLPTPTSLDQLQANYVLFNSMRARIGFQ